MSLNKLARRKAEGAEWSEAERLYQRTIEIEPSPVYIIHYAQFLFDLGKIDEAAVQYRRAIEQSPAFLDAYRGLANLYLAIGFLDSSLSLVDELARHTGDTSRSSFYRGELYYMAEKYRPAIEQGRLAVQQDPDWAQSWSTLSRALNQVGELDEALEAARRYIELDKDSPYPYAARGRIYMMNGSFNRAADDFRKAVEVDSDYWDGLELLANVHLYRGDYDRASELIKQLASSNIAHVRASAGNLQASVLTMQGKLQDALGVLDSGLVADSLDNVAFMVRYKRLLMVFIYEELGLYDLALQNLEAYIESSRKYRPGDVLAWRDYQSYLLALKGDFESARAAVERLKSDIELSSKPRNIIAYWLTLGSIEFVSGNYDEALHFIRMDADSVADRESRDYFQTQYMLGRASLGAGQSDSAIAQFSRLLENFSERRLGCLPWVSKARYYLGEAYERSGRTDEAVAQYEIFLDQWKNADPGLAVINDAEVRLDKLKKQL